MNKKRKPTYPISELILNRHSSRAISDELLKEEEFMPLFEAARWAPSSSNNQLWRFIYAKKNTHHWDLFFNLLNEGNKKWCKNAALLCIIISRKRAYYKDKPQITHSFEAGAAFENLALEGSRRNLVVHAMIGFDIEKARKVLQISDIWNIECMICIGKKGKIEILDNKLIRFAHSSN